MKTARRLGASAQRFSIEVEVCVSGDKLATVRRVGRVHFPGLAGPVTLLPTLSSRLPSTVRPCDYRSSSRFVLSTRPVMITQQQQKPNKGSSRTEEAQRHYRCQNAHAVGPEADPRRARERKPPSQTPGKSSRRRQGSAMLSHHRL